MNNEQAHYAKSELIRYQILQYLIEHNGECSGAYLSSQLGINRSAVSKQIKALEQWGIKIQAKQGKGYHLTQPLTLLDSSKIKSALAPYHAELIPVIKSTNSYLMAKLEASTISESGSVCLTEFQTQGRGRRGKQWFTPFASQLCFSMYWQIEQGVAAVMGLSLVVGLSLVHSLRRLTKQKVMVKWPNDLYLNGKKLAGILIEMKANTGEPAHLIIGVGINLTVPQNEIMDRAIEQPWCNLFNQHDTNLNKANKERNNLTIELIKDLQQALKQYNQTGLTETQLTQWKAIDLFDNKPVRLLIGNKEIFGCVYGIDKQGGLILTLANGKTETFIGGDISLRGQL